MTSPPPSGRRQLVRTTAIAAGVIAGVAALIAAPLLLPGSDEIRHPPRRPPKAATQTSALALTAQGRLLALAARTTTAANDTHVGRYETTRVQVWTRSGIEVSRSDTIRWRSVDGSGRITVRRLPDRPDPTRLPDSAEHAALTAAPATTLDFPPGGLPSAVPLPIAVGVERLMAQLSSLAPSGDRPQSLVTAVSTINRYHYLDAAHRADVLRVLATIPTIAFRGQTTDIAGRAGLTWVLDTSDGAELLTFDPRTAELLAYQNLLNTSPPTLSAYLLFLERDRVERLT